ncbi:LytTR family DNA-binding domain-containing protein [Cohnella luojiensis]|uniref:LytTR family transcriptional regulator n=1 Tax=Cohnella luojiensis TaxID=652876 RepID=A0A4Y8LUY5_9BACL|nr:LytTR family DNA-binding domain-containing protein [Cohnella luojiensis]TFE25526.1 LytTR family transcriptional regulator [Cohnella luojiensis]
MLLPLLNSKGEHRLVEAREIKFIQTDGAGEIEFYTYDEKYRTISTIKDISLLLEAAGFIRVDRGTIVNSSSIDSFDPLLNVARIRTIDSVVLLSVSGKMLGKIELRGDGGV